MSRSTCSQTIASARRQITNSSNAISASKKRIYQGNLLVSNSKTSITNSKYQFILTVAFLTSYFLLATLQKFSSLLDLESRQIYPKNERSGGCLTPQENLQEIMTHPFKTGLCPYCGHAFPKVKAWVVNWNCLACGWFDNLFN